MRPTRAAVLVALAVLSPLAAVAAPELSVDMNGEYRCDNGKTFAVKVRSSPVMMGRMVIPAVAEAGSYGVVTQPTIRNEMVGVDLHGATVVVDGKRYKLMLQNDNTMVLRDKKKQLLWEVSGATTPFSGRLSDATGVIGENCILAEPTRIN